MTTVATPLGVVRRAATAADEPFLQELYASTRDDLEPLGWPDEVRSTFCDLQWRAQRAGYGATYPHARDEIIELDGVPTGRLLLDTDGDAVVLVDVALLPSACGRGIGGGLIEEVKALAARTHRGVLLHVTAGNPARRLYERHGFVACGHSGVHTELRWQP